jgi:multidrug transporter EmrE-like cation transporter
MASAVCGTGLDRSTVAHLAQTSFGDDDMNAVKIAALVLIVAGILGLVYGGFSYTKETHEAKLGPIELTVKDKETVNIPVWAGVGAIAIGGVLLLLGGRKS